ncbi:MAG: enoyl-CoA hydratase-related protein, partial [Gluconacetobacter sp.]
MNGVAEREEPVAGRVRLTIEGEVATIVFDRPQARNAMTWQMYRDLGEAIERIDTTPGLRVAVLRGRGDRLLSPGPILRSFA